MNDGTGVRWRAGAAVAAVAAIAVLAACGGGSAPAAAAQTTYQKTLAYAQCVRVHSVPGFPDPNSQGNFLFRDNHGFHMGSPQFESANKACQHLLPNQGVTSAAQVKQAATQALKFTTCMRAHGVPGFPDPIVQTNGITWGQGSFNSQSPVFKSAQRSCRRFLPDGGA